MKLFIKEFNLISITGSFFIYVFQYTDQKFLKEVIKCKNYLYRRGGGV